METGRTVTSTPLMPVIGSFDLLKQAEAKDAAVNQLMNDWPSLAERPQGVISLIQQWQAEARALRAKAFYLKG
jgi:hypothetical protein